MKIVLLCAPHLNDFQYSVINSILVSGRKVCLCLIDVRPGDSMIARLKRNLKKGRGGYVLIMAIKKYFAKEQFIRTRDLMNSKNVEVFETENILAEETINKIKEKKPDVMCLIGGFGIIKNEYLNLTKFGVFSFHHGDLRRYRGQPPAFWELYNGETEIGVTVQKINAGLDTGIPVVEKKIRIGKTDSYRKVLKKIFKESEPMMSEALYLVNKIPDIPLNEYGKLYTLPNLRQWLMFNVKMFRRWIRSIFWDHDSVSKTV